jgi:hypothetical protein
LIQDEEDRYFDDEDEVDMGETQESELAEGEYDY